MKKLLFTLALLLVAFSAHAATLIDGIYYNLDSSTNTAEVTYDSDKYTGDVTIPLTVTYDGSMYNVTSIGNWAFQYCTGLTSVTIPNSVTSIGRRAFDGCISLNMINISDIAVWCRISFDYSEDNPLKYAHNLYLNGNKVTDLIIPSSVTKIENHAFYGCTGLASIDIGNSVTIIGNGAFEDCTSLTSIDIGNSVTNIGNDAFEDCTSLTSIIVSPSNPYYDTRNNCNAVIETATNKL